MPTLFATCVLVGILNTWFGCWVVHREAHIEEGRTVEHQSLLLNDMSLMAHEEDF